MKRIEELSALVQDNISNVIVGKDDVIEMVWVCLIARGHVLIEDIPGVGKTMLARSLARSINFEFRRIQFTPDLLPSDIVGVSIYDESLKEFVYKPGPLFTQILLADEINRATPKTQSALLEGMEERQITVDGITYALPESFMVIATQNPVEYQGTFPLPEAQIDRFMMRVQIGYPDIESEGEMLEAQRFSHPITQIQPVVDIDDVRLAQESTREVHVSDGIKKFILEIVQKTRKHPDITLGASPRGSLGLFRTSQALAAVKGRAFVTPDDVKRLVKPVLGHRIIQGPSARLRDTSPEEVLDQILGKIVVPGGIGDR